MDWKAFLSSFLASFISFGVIVVGLGLLIMSLDTGPAGSGAGLMSFGYIYFLGPILLAVGFVISLIIASIFTAISKRSNEEQSVDHKFGVGRTVMYTALAVFVSFAIFIKLAL